MGIRKSDNLILIFLFTLICLFPFDGAFAFDGTLAVREVESGQMVSINDIVGKYRMLQSRMDDVSCAPGTEKETREYKDFDAFMRRKYSIKALKPDGIFYDVLNGSLRIRLDFPQLAVRRWGMDTPARSILMFVNADKPGVDASKVLAQRDRLRVDMQVRLDPRGTIVIDSMDITHESKVIHSE